MNSEEAKIFKGRTELFVRAADVLGEWQENIIVAGPKWAPSWLRIHRLHGSAVDLFAARSMVRRDEQ